MFKTKATVINDSLESGAAIAHRYEDLIHIFNDCFARRYNTRLVLGQQEPIYLPVDDEVSYNRIVFAHGFFSSALHEISHWCVAGHERRKQVDFGYWYAPDGRNAEQQREFEKVEVKPQALEWIFSKACHKPFRVSADNLNGEPTNIEPFKASVYQQVVTYCDAGLPEDADIFRHALCRAYQQSSALAKTDFSLDEL